MPNNAKNSNQRLKILYLYKILLDYTDEQHYLTMPQIIAHLENYGVGAERKAIYDDIEALRNFGLDVVSFKGKISGYYVASREFQLPELKLLADAVSSSRFLTEKKSAELLKKIESLSSVYEARQLQRQVYVADRVKSINERIYLNVDVIHRAIDMGRKISFRYFDYGLDKKKKYRDGLRICSPYALTWNDERYYLIAHYEKYNNISNFRIDRMESVEILEEKSEPKPSDFSISEYMKSTFSMFSGNAQPVTLRFVNDFINVAIDRFGKDITIIPDGDEHFTVRVNVKAEAPFFGWLFKFGTGIEIIKPRELREEYIRRLSEIMEAMIKNR